MLRLDQACARAGQAALAILRKRVRQTHADDEVQNGITQELQPLIVTDAARRFAGIRGMGQGFDEYLPIAKLIANVRLESLEGTLRHASKLRIRGRGRQQPEPLAGKSVCRSQSPGSQFD